MSDGLEPLLELATVLGAGDQRAHVERHDALVLQPLGHVAADDALGQPLDDRGLADAGRPDEHGIVLRPPRQDLDHPANLLVAADDRVELALLGGGGEVAPVLLERFVGPLGVLARHALPAAHGGQRLEQLLAREAGRPQRLGHQPVREAGESQKQVLDADELVLHLLGGSLGPDEDVVHARGDVDLAPARARSGHAGQALDRLLEALEERLRVAAGLLHDAGSHAAVLAEQRRSQVLGFDLLLTVPLSERLRLAYRALGLVGQPIGIHQRISFLARRDLRRHAEHLLVIAELHRHWFATLPVSWPTIIDDVPLMPHRRCRGLRAIVLAGRSGLAGAFPDPAPTEGFGLKISSTTGPSRRRCSMSP